MSESAVRVAVLFPELLGTYGDGGNIVVLRQRLAWRGLECELVGVGLQDEVPGDCDLYVLGGGEDKAQALALEALGRTRALQSAVDRDVPVLGVCAGLQLLGTALVDRDGTVTPALGLLDLETRLLPGRAVGEVIAEPVRELGLPVLTGFANHGGSTVLGPAARPLAAVVSGPGNARDGSSAVEGARQGSVLATYLHGPVLARNPALADLVLSRAVGAPLAPLDVPEVEVLRAERIAAARDR